MATAIPRPENKECLNWYRDSFALLHLKEGLEAFIDQRVKQLHEELHTIVPHPLSRHGPSAQLQSSSSAPTQIQSCKTCTDEQVQRPKKGKGWKVNCKSSNKICNEWLKRMLTYHVNSPNPGIECTNLNPPLWPFDAWEVAKLFLPFGSKGVTEAKDADVAKLLKLMKNCLFMHDSFDNKYFKSGDVDKVLDIRNNLMHSATLCVSDDQLQQDTDWMQKLLRSLRTSPDESEAVRKAVDDITKVKTMEITSSKKVEALKVRMQAVETDMASLKNKCQEYDQARRDQNTTAEQLKALEIDHDKTKAEIEKLHKSLRETLTVHSQELQRLGSRVDKLEAKDIPSPEKPAEEVTKDVQEHLVQLYANIGWDNPCNLDTELAQIYVPPDIKFVMEKKKGILKERATKCPPGLSHSFDERDIFLQTGTSASETLQALSRLLSLDSDEPCTNVYLTGDAGSGKSALCHQIVSTWCEAVKNILYNRKITNENISFMADFKYVFYIVLRSTRKYTVQDMIKETLFRHGPSSVQSFDIETALKSDKCLVILDGLDEWTVPEGATPSFGINESVPDRNVVQKTSVFLTTLRSWKFYSINLKTTQVDKHVELCGIGADSSRKLATSLVKHLDESKTDKESNVENFFQLIQDKKLLDLSSVPVLLIQMVTLWHYGKDIGKSQVQLFCSMVGLLFERAGKHFPAKPEVVYQREQDTTRLPECFINQIYCKNYKSLLLCLAKLAYEGLFDKRKEETLIFSSSTVHGCGIPEPDIVQCLKCGVLSQNKDYKDYTRRDCTYSFLHKKVQEFLASLYIATGDHAEIMKRLKQTCKTLEITLEMDQVWLFLSGMNGGLANQVIAHLANVMNADQGVQDYRRKGDLYDSRYKDMITNIQSTIANYVTESAECGQTLGKVMLVDLFFDDNKLTSAKQVVPHIDRSALKSAYLCSINLAADDVTAVTNLLENCSSLEKLVLFDSYPQATKIRDAAIAQTAKVSCNTLTWLRLSFVELTDITIPAMINCNVIRLLHCKAAHGVYKKTLDAISNMLDVNQLVVDIECTDHDRQCRPRLDISKCSQLKKVELHCMTVEGMTAVADRLEEIMLNDVTLERDLCGFVDRLSKTKLRATVKLVQVTVTLATMDLKGLLNQPAFKEKDCRYDDIYETWDISFNINTASRSGPSDTSDSDEA